MNPIRALAAAVRGDRGDGDPIAVLAGSALFLIAGIGIAGLLTMSLASASRAQSNTELTQAVESQINVWKSTPYLKIVEEPASANASLNEGQGPTISAGTRSVHVSRQVVKLAGSGAYQITVSAPRQSLLTEPLGKQYCLSALKTPKENCMTLSAVVTPSGFDKIPALPSGLTVTPVDLTAARGMSLADLDISLLNDAAGDLNLRVALLPVAGKTVTDGEWNLTLTCSDETALAATPDSRFVKAEKNSRWMTARVALHGADKLVAASCPRPQLRMWSDLDPQPRVSDLAVDSSGAKQIKAWRVFGVKP